MSTRQYLARLAGVILVLCIALLALDAVSIEGDAGFLMFVLICAALLVGFEYEAWRSFGQDSHWRERKLAALLDVYFGNVRLFRLCWFGGTFLLFVVLNATIGFVLGVPGAFLMALAITFGNELGLRLRRREMHERAEVRNHLEHTA